MNIRYQKDVVRSAKRSVQYQKSILADFFSIDLYIIIFHISEIKCSIENVTNLRLSFYCEDIHPGGNLLLARYHASTAVGFLVLAQYWLDP